MNDVDSEIIVVDDDMSMSQAIERLLTAAGCKARLFSSAEELLSSGACASAGVLIFDIQLPGMSGVELQRKLAADGDVTPVIFITGQDRPLFRDQARRAGATYLTKPFAGSELIQAVRQHLAVA